MSFQITSAKITGTPGPSGWTQGYEFKPEDNEKLRKRGHLFAVISIRKNKEDFGGEASGRELLSRLHEEYFGNLETSAFFALKNSVEKVIKEYSELSVEAEISAVAIVEDVVYSAAGGGGKVSIYRGGSIAKILESGLAETVSASGYPQDGDFIILGTKSFFESLPQGILKASLEGPDMESLVESLAPAVHANPNPEGIGTVIVKFGDSPDLKNNLAKLPTVNFGNKIGVILKSFFKKVFSRVARIIPERRIFIKGKSLDESVSRSRKSMFWVGAILLVLLLVSIGFGIKQNRNKKYRSGYLGQLTEAKDNLTQAESILGADPVRARELFFDSQAKVQDLISRKIKDKELNDLESKLKSKEGEIVGIYREEPNLYLDLSLLSSGFKGDKVFASGENLYVFDKNGKKVVGININTKKTQVLAGPEQIDDASDIFAYENNVYGVFNDGIYLLGDKKIKKIEKDWEGVILAVAYTGNIYILDKTASSIWRYSGSGGDFGVRQNWMAPGIKIDFSNAKEVVIDGSVWVLSDPFNIQRLSLGSPLQFKPKGVSPDLTNAAAIYSDEEEKYLYVLDPSQKRVVVLDKTGEYRAQYLSDSLGEATGLVVSEKTAKAIILTGSKLYSIELKHL